MEKTIKELKLFRDWFKIQVDSDLNDLLAEKHFKRLDNLIQDTEKWYQDWGKTANTGETLRPIFEINPVIEPQIHVVVENKETKDILDRIAMAIENAIPVHCYLQEPQSFWKRVKQWLSWS